MFHLYDRYPCLNTVRLLLQGGADINAFDVERTTPLHVFVANSNSCNETILQILVDAGAHLDYVDGSGETAIDAAFHANIKQLLKARNEVKFEVFMC